MPGTVRARYDDPTFAALLTRAMPKVKALLRRLCTTGADADDVLQDTLAKVWRLRSTCDPERSGEAWLLQAAFRTYCDHRRRLRAMPRVEALGDHQSGRTSPCMAEVRDELTHRLAALDPFERDLLLRFHRDGCTLQELAGELGMPVNTVKSHLHRARVRLAAAARKESP